MEVMHVRSRASDVARYTIHPDFYLVLYHDINGACRGSSQSKGTDVNELALLRASCRYIATVVEHCQSTMASTRSRLDEVLGSSS